MAIPVTHRNRTTAWLWCTVFLASALCLIGLANPIAADDSTAGDPRFSRESLEQLQDILSRASDELYLWNRANRAYLQSIGPAYVARGSIAELREMAEANAQIKELGQIYDHAGKMAELAAAIKGDLEDKKPFLSLSSHTIDVFLQFTVEWATDTDRVAKALRQGLISPATGKALGYLHLEYGGGDMVVGAKRLMSGEGDRAEAWATALDGVNKSAWAGLGFALSGGNSAVAKTFSILGDMAVQSGRAITAPLFTAYNNWTTGADQNLIQIWMIAQTSSVRHGEKMQSFEEFYKSDPVILSQVNEADRRLANARLDLASPSIPSNPKSLEVVTRTFRESYQEVCKAGFCVRTDLSSSTPPQTTQRQFFDQHCSAGTPCEQPSGLKGVFVGPVPSRSGSIDDAAAQDILSLPRLGPAH